MWPAPRPQFQPATGEHVGGGDLAGQQRRVPERGVEHQGADPEPLRRRSRRDQSRKRRGDSQVISGEHGVVTLSLGTPAVLSEVVPRVDTEDVVREAKTLHRPDPAMTA
jgi:hypothetical protein